MKPLSDSTPITIGLLVIIIGGVVWLTSIYSTANQSLVLSQKDDAQITSLNDRTTRIETKIDDLLTSKTALR